MLRRSTCYQVPILLGATLMALSPAFCQESAKVPFALEAGSPAPVFDSYHYQSLISAENGLSALIRANPAVPEDVLTLGFAAKSDKARFFLIGSLFSEAVAYLHSDSLNLVADRLGVLRRELIELKAPSSLYGFVSLVQNRAERGDYTFDVFGDFMTLLQPMLEECSAQRGEDYLCLFQAGCWLVDLSLTVAAGQSELLPMHQAALEYFGAELKRMEAPSGVLDALDRITGLIGKGELTQVEADEVLDQVRQIQSVLGL